MSAPKWDHECDCGVKHATFAQEWDCILVRDGMGPEVARITRLRTADRLAGYTHEEVAKMHPFPKASS